MKRKKIFKGLIATVLFLGCFCVGLMSDVRGYVLAMIFAALAVVLFCMEPSQDADGKETRQLEEPPTLEQPFPTPTPTPTFLSLSEQGNHAVEELHWLHKHIVDPEIRDMMQQLEETTRKILDRVGNHPEKRSQVRQFMDYYLPTTVKILNSYYQLESIASPEVQTLEARLEPMLEKLCYAFDRQLDTLLRDEAMDVSADITVMEQMLQQEGLGGGASGIGIQMEL